MVDRKMHDDEVATDAALVRRLLAAQFPQWADLPIAPVPSAGTVNAIYRLGEDMVVRLPRVERWASDTEMEARWLPKLAPYLPLAIPAPRGVGAAGEGYPFPWSVYRWLEGVDATVEPIADLSAAAADLAAFVVALRAVDLAGLPPSRRGPLAKRDADTRKAIGSLEGMIDTDAATSAWEASLRAPIWDAAPVWTHADLLPTNLLVTEGRLSAVIDFGCLGVGDPAYDMLCAWSVLSAESRDVFRSGVAVDSATWLRGRGFALSVALIQLPYYQTTNPVLAANARRVIGEVLGDLASGG